MTFQRWCMSVARFGVTVGALWYAVSHIHNAWGLVILATVYVQGFLLLVNTVDLLFGRWIRRRAPQPIPGGTRVRRVILEEVEY